VPQIAGQLRDALRSGRLLTDAPVVAHRSDGIDALRGAFALWVVVAHLVPWSTLTQGAGGAPEWLAIAMKALARVFQPVGELHPAVLGFVVLSGYCIHRNGFRSGREGLGDYGWRRAFRILPVYLAATAVGAVGWSMATTHSADLTRLLTATAEIDVGCMLAKLTFIAAVVPTHHPCAFQGNAPLATVMVEVVLYAIYGALAWLCLGRRREWIVWVTATLAFLAGLVVAAISSRRSELYNWWQNSSVWGFLPYWWLGCLFLHRAFKLDTATLKRIDGLWIVLTLAVLATRSLVIAELRKLALAVLMGAAIARIDESGLRVPGWLAALGRSGYSLYAFHAPVVYIALIAGVAWWIVLPLTIVTGALCYVAIEKPFMRLGRYLSKSPPRGQATDADLAARNAAHQRPER
jgi:peptidoglycan/LPS O-acetylase OafA/YrhL